MTPTNVRGFGTRERFYPIFGNATGKQEPDYGRVVRGLTEADLVEEIDLGRGEPGYRNALQAEYERRENTR